MLAEESRPSAHGLGILAEGSRATAREAAARDGPKTGGGIISQLRCARGAQGSRVETLSEERQTRGKATKQRCVLAQERAVTLKAPWR